MRPQEEAEGWVTEDEPQDSSQAPQKSGTFHWVAHGFKLGAHKIKRSTKHKVKSVKPELEIQSAL